ncbi:MAG: hypothetical protein WKF96_23075 [Solirubrobacteraceae bacterium]
MAEITGKYYGLPPAPGHAPPTQPQPIHAMTAMDPAEYAELQRRARNRARQPWEQAA